MPVWTKRDKDGNSAAFPDPFMGGGNTTTRGLAPGEPPICCPETRKNPSVTKPIYPSGTYQCPPEEGGCGSTWTKEGR